jgi:cytochrome c-type biogenesis protein CcmF
LLFYRWDKLSSDQQLTSLLSREALFLLNNLVFLSILVICFWGMNYSWISQLITGEQVTVGPPYYERATGPLFAVLLFLMGVAPLSAWGHSTMKTLGRALWKPTLLAVAITALIYFTYTQNPYAIIGFFLVAFTILITFYEYGRGVYARMRGQNENVLEAFLNLTGRNRRRYGGYIVHLSIMLMAIGVLGIELFQVETQGTLAVGDSLQLSGYTIKYREVASWDDAPAGVNYTRAVVDVYDQNGKFLGNLHPRKDYYYDSQQPMTIPGQLASMKDELYLLLIDWEPISQAGTTFKIFVNPLVNWLWLGSLLFLVGIIVAAWPDRDPEPVTVREGKRVPQVSSAD